MKDKIVSAMQKFSRAVIQPSLFLSVTGLILAICTILKLDFMPGFLKSAGDFFYTIIFNSSITQLSFVFCIGITVALAKKKKTEAAIISVLTYFSFLYANNAWLSMTGMLADPAALSGTGQAMVLGIQVMDMSVFLGITLGCLNGWLFNKFCDTEFPELFRLYGGARFAAIVCIFATSIYAIIMCYVWPAVSAFLGGSAVFIENTGYFGMFIYGFLNRVLIPTGLHSLVNMPFMYTSIGGTMELAGEVVSGCVPIWASQLGHMGELTALDDSIKWMMYGYSKMFGCIGVGLAFIKTAKPENRKATIGMIVPIMFSACLSGITEPLEFMFCFVSLPLWLVYSVIDGIVPMIAFALGSRFPIAGGLLQQLPTLLAVPMKLGKQHIAIIVGLLSIAVWYFAFVFCIKKWNLKTPGRVKVDGGMDDILGEKKEEAKPAAVSGDVSDIIEGLGGKENILSVGNCFSRLRVEVKDISKLDEARINQFKNTGIVKKGNNVQIIIGLKVQNVKEDVCQALGME